MRPTACLSKRFSGDADAACLGPTLGEPLTYRSICRHRAEDRKHKETSNGEKEGWRERRQGEGDRKGWIKIHREKQ